MPSIWAEWYCKKCEGLHRISYTLKFDSRALHTIRRPIYRKNNILIDDPAYKKGHKSNLQARDKYAVFCDPETPMHILIATLKEYMLENYTAEEKTLQVDVCLDT